jgi:hypothetical protein
MMIFSRGDLTSSRSRRALCTELIVFPISGSTPSVTFGDAHRLFHLYEQVCPGLRFVVVWMSSPHVARVARTCAQRDNICLERGGQSDHAFQAAQRSSHKWHRRHLDKARSEKCGLRQKPNRTEHKRHRSPQSRRGLRRERPTETPERAILV